MKEDVYPQNGNTFFVIGCNWYMEYRFAHDKKYTVSANVIFYFGATSVYRHYAESHAYIVHCQRGVRQGLIGFRIASSPASLCMGKWRRA